LAKITRLQPRLLSRGLSEDERAEALAALERLEVEERALRAGIYRSDPRLAGLRRPELATLRAVQKALGPDQALLAFQTNQSNKGLAERLYRDLLKEALADLPLEISRFVILPDGILHRLPFDALRAEPTGEPLGARFEITLAPSATVWLRLSAANGIPLGWRALAFADPLLPEATDASGSFRQVAPWKEPLRLGRLPHARREARSVVRYLGSGSRVLTGSAALERFLKSAAPGEFRVLHLAAHAVTDDARPERSAVLLAPGSAGEERSPPDSRDRGAGLTGSGRHSLRLPQRDRRGSGRRRGDESGARFPSGRRPLRRGEPLAASRRRGRASR
jgi:hypothetical protein